MALKNSMSVMPESLPPVFFKLLADVLCEPLSLTYVAALSEREVPERFRDSIVVPIHKKGKKEKFGNYRPVAQESVPYLIMEELLVDCMERHLLAGEPVDRN